MRTLSIFVIVIVISIAVDAQIVIPPDKDQLLKGEVMGQTLLAEKNNFPSPQKILELKDELGLMKDQLKKIDEMLKNLPVSIAVKGQEIVEAEEDLDKAFASGNINEKTLRAKLESIGKLRADLRFTHLQVYLKMKQILSVNQWERLMELVGSESR
jgi:Spy/CpxP family protein refolding chaperone